LALNGGNGLHVNVMDRYFYGFIRLSLFIGFMFVSNK